MLTPLAAVVVAPVSVRLPVIVQLNTQEKWDLSGNEDITCLFNTRDGESVIIGRILKQNTYDNPLGWDKPIVINDLKFSQVDELIIQA